jgi:hypothetical protein
VYYDEIAGKRVENPEGQRGAVSSSWYRLENCSPALRPNLRFFPFGPPPVVRDIRGWPKPLKVVAVQLGASWSYLLYGHRPQSLSGQTPDSR